jgi:hypothetical protein
MLALPYINNSQSSEENNLWNDQQERDLKEGTRRDGEEIQGDNSYLHKWHFDTN